MLKILVADDDRLFRHLIKNVLTNAGHDVFVACNGEEACDIASEHEIDIVFMDMNMPRVDGWTATLQIKHKINHRIHVVAVSAYGLPGDRARATAAGCTHFLVKPIDVNLLTKTITEVLDGEAKHDTL